MLKECCWLKDEKTTVRLKTFQTASNIIEIQRIGIATRGIFRENISFTFEKLNNQCKVYIILMKSFCLNGKTELSEIILALLENFFLYF